MIRKKTVLTAISLCLAAMAIPSAALLSLADAAARPDTGAIFYETDPQLSLAENEARTLAQTISRQPAPDGIITIIEPLAGVVCPPNLAAPAFIWDDSNPDSVHWLISLRLEDREIGRVLGGSPWWTPSPEAWTKIRNEAGSRTVTAVIRGAGEGNGSQVFSEGRTEFSWSRDPVDDRLVYIQKPLPFKTAKERPQEGTVVAANLTSYGEPRIVMSGQPVCFNCHAVSGNGRAYGLDMDIRGDKGGFSIADIRGDMALGEQDLFSWNKLKAPEPAPYNMGLFAQLSLDGRYLASTVGETSVFVMMDDIFYSQLFYPATGRIGMYDRRAGRFFTLPGADSGDVVQTGPAWSPDGRMIAFSRTTVDRALVKKVKDGKLKAESPGQSIHALNQKYPVQFDLYTVPFNEGKGGPARPLEGASANGYSNFFPRYSPDGKWIVFTQSKTGLVLQPDSRLCIIPAGGGRARVLAANTGKMNSWHTWSSNSRWLAFSSKANSPYTEIYLTHMDENGDSSPPLRLYRLSSTTMAAMTPEFLPPSAPDIRSIGLAEPEKAIGKSQAVDGR